MVHYIPEGYNSATPYLILQNAAEAITYYKKVFNAQERLRMNAPDGKIMHAELIIGNSVIMLADAGGGGCWRTPAQMGGSPVIIHLYVENVDAVVDQALYAGAMLLESVDTKFYGDRTGSFKDPFGHVWSIATHVEDVSPQEMGKRAQAIFA